MERKEDSCKTGGAGSDAQKPEPGTPLIELKNIYKIYYMGDEEVHANDGISLSIGKGEFVPINPDNACHLRITAAAGT